MPISLSVNLNKVALLRNSRGGENPSPKIAGQVCLDSGAYGLTLHWRQDNRHARADDVRALRALCDQRGAEFNLEGDDREELIALAIELRVSQFTLVPVTPGEVTSDHGWDVPRQHAVIAPIIARLKVAGIRTAMFMDCDPATWRRRRPPASIGSSCIPSRTRRRSARRGSRTSSNACRRTARAAAAAGLAVNAGHDLNLRNTPLLARMVPEIVEASIGHALLADALYLGLAEAVRRYVRACNGEAVDAPLTQ